MTLQGRFAVLCPGQGAQAVGMGRAWLDASPAAREVFERADAIVGDALGRPLSAICFDGPDDTLNRTDVSQPAIFVTSVACWRGVTADHQPSPVPAAAAGLSLGEYTALHVAGAVGFEDALRLVLLRGRAMQDAAEAAPSGMLALIGADEPKAHELCERAAAGEVLVCANFNAPGQIVISGTLPAIDRAEPLAGEMGLRAARLPVAGAFHSPLMQPAADRLADALARTPFQPPVCPVYCNVTAAAHDDAGTGSIEGGIRRRLAEQLTAPVRWAEQCQNIIGNLGQHAAYLELAPGRTLAGLMRRIDRSIKVQAHDEPTQPN